MQHREKPFSEIFFTIVVSGFLIAWIAIVIPSGVGRRRTIPRNACINNLRQLDGATQQWILESAKAPTNTPTWSEIKPYLGRDTEASLKRYHCPEDPSKSFSTSYILGTATVPARCKINPKHKLN